MDAEVGGRRFQERSRSRILGFARGIAAGAKVEVGCLLGVGV